MKGLLFADNPLLHSPSVEAMSESLNILNKYSLTRPPLPINQDKSKIMIFQKRHTILNSVYRITTGEQKLEQLKIYCYLGLMISSTGHFDGVIRYLTEKARTTYYMLRNSSLKYNHTIKHCLQIF